MSALVIETSTTLGGVALFEGNELVFTEQFTADRSHTSSLFVVIERALANRPAPDQIIVGLGPGSYAGVRIAISAAIGISVATGAAMLGVPSIAALAEGEYLAIGDARRGGFSFSHVRDGLLAEGPLVLTRDEVLARLASIAGIPVFSSEPLDFPGLEIRHPRIDLLGRLGVANRGITARGTLEPLYLSEPHITLPKPIRTG